MTQHKGSARRAACRRLASTDLLQHALAEIQAMNLPCGANSSAGPLCHQTCACRCTGLTLDSPGPACCALDLRGKTGLQAYLATCLCLQVPQDGIKANPAT